MIQLYAAEITPLLDEAAFMRALERVTPERRSRTLALAGGENRARSLAVGLLLEQAVRPFGCSALCRTEPGGKPYLKEREDLPFSLAHSGRYALCAIGGTSPLGVDVEKIGSLRVALARRAFSAAENCYLTALDEQQRGEGFTALWTAKESYIKKTGVGLSLPLPALQPPFDGPEVMAADAELPCRIRWYRDLPNYLVALCAECSESMPSGVQLVKV